MSSTAITISVPPLRIISLSQSPADRSESERSGARRFAAAASRSTAPVSVLTYGRVGWNFGLLPQLQDDHLQSRDVGEVLGVRREQPEIALNGLRRKPEVVDANVWISARLSELCGQAPERLGRFDGHPHLGFSPESSKHGGRSLLLRTGSQQLQAEPDFGDVDWREIYRILTSDGVDIGRSKSSAFHRDP